MKTTNNMYKILFLSLAIGLGSCEKFLDRPPQTAENDDTAWNSEANVRLYVNQYYTALFPGYGTGFSTAGAPLMSNTHTDDVFALGNQSNFTRAVPNSSTWGYAQVRSFNILIDRVQNRMAGILSAEAQRHWLGVGRFLRGYRYSRLAFAFGDVPYYDREIFDNEAEELYKSRTPRNDVMDKVYEDLEYAMENVRANDGSQQINRYVVAGLASRIALYEGTWQKYHANDSDRAKKFLDLAIKAADIVIASGRYDIVTDYRSLFTSGSLEGNKDVLIYRHYDPAVGVTHSIASNANLEWSTNNGPTADLLKAYLCTDGQAWQNSALANAGRFDMNNLVATRDPRFEATFHGKPEPLNRASLFYVTKFFPRSGEATKALGQPLPANLTSDKNETDAPVLRYAEVLLNWIEAKAELAALGGAAVAQGDIDASVNKIRNRPLAAEAVARGVTKTNPLMLNTLPNDPARDPSVLPLLWEVRRERRMEFAFETNRLDDLKRWKKLDYMDTAANPHLLAGGWVDFPAELPSELKTGLSVVALDGTQTVYNGSNANLMKGFYRNTSTNGRLPFLNLPNVNPYLTPVGRNQIDFYASRGYVLEQTEGWGD